MTNLLFHHFLQQGLPPTCNQLQINKEKLNVNELTTCTRNDISSLWLQRQWKWTHCVCLVLTPAFDIVSMAADLVLIWVRVRWALTRVWAGDRRVLPQAPHIPSLPLVRHQILNFLTEELLNSLKNTRISTLTFLEKALQMEHRILLLLGRVFKRKCINNCQLAKS